MKTILITLFLSLNFILAQTEEPDPLDFFPSAVGNYWEYDHERPNHNYTIVRDSIAEDGSKYIFYFEPPLYYGADYKIDSTGNVFRRPQFSNWLEYKLKADSGDTWIVKKEEADSRAILAQLKTNGLVFIFGEFRNAMKFDYYELEPGDTVLNDSAFYLYSKTLAESLGLVITEDGAREPEVLLGCIIDGVTYGEITDIKGDEQILTSIMLKQNYPNPFNSQTTIEYDLDQAQNVELVLYNILGEQITVLESAYKQSGSYKIFS